MPRARKASASGSKAKTTSARPAVAVEHDLGGGAGDRNPLFHGFVMSLLDAFLIIEVRTSPINRSSTRREEMLKDVFYPESISQGCRHGLIGRFVTKPCGLEKDALMQSGNVVVWEEEEIGMKRWNDCLVSGEPPSPSPSCVQRYTLTSLSPPLFLRYGPSPGRRAPSCSTARRRRRTRCSSTGAME